MNEVNPRRGSATAGIAFSLCAFIYVAISLLISAMISWIGIEKSSDSYKYLSYLVAPIAISIGSIITLKTRKQSLRELLPVKCHFKYYIIALMLIFGLVFSVSKINNVVLDLLKLLNYPAREQESYLPSLEGWNFLPAFLVVAVLPAVFEEFLFRGLLFGTLKEGVGDIRAIFLGGFCFALFHGSPEQTVYQFICGCIFTFIADRSGSILPCVFMHFLNNAFVLIIYACGAVDAAGNLAVPFWGDLTLTIVSAVIFAVAAGWLVLDKKPLKECSGGAVAEFFAFASIGILLMAVIWIMSFFGI